MAANYGALKTDVAAWLNRADLTANIPTYISGALARINLELQLVGGITDQQQVAVAQTASGVDSLALPTDYQTLRFIKISGGTDSVDVLETVVYDQLIDTYGDVNTGQPQQVAIFDGSFYFRPVPDDVYQVQIGYIKRYIDFANDSATNWLLTNAGNLLLYAACLEAAPQLADDPRIATWGGAFKEQMRLVVVADRRSQRGPKPAGVRIDPYLTGGTTFSITTG